MQGFGLHIDIEGCVAEVCSENALKVGVEVGDMIVGVDGIAVRGEPEVVRALADPNLGGGQRGVEFMLRKHYWANEFAHRSQFEGEASPI